MKLGIIHGPNLNMLGQREPEVYGRDTLAQLDEKIRAAAAEVDAEVVTFQSNKEGELIDRVQQLAAEVDGFIVNAGGYSHTSIALRDALVGVNRPFIEVHLSNVMGREEFRHKSVLADKAIGTIMGFGADSYLLGVRALSAHLRRAR